MSSQEILITEMLNSSRTVFTTQSAAIGKRRKKQGGRYSAAEQIRKAGAAA